MPQALVPIISALGTATGGVVGATLIMGAEAIALGPAIIGSATLKGSK
jgi:hypothetical protein